VYSIILWGVIYISLECNLHPHGVFFFLLVQKNVAILLKVYFQLHKWRELYIQPSFDDERRFAKTIAGWVGRVDMPSDSFSTYHS